ncbi:MAG: hypothetical protein C0481_05295 [Phenylobacterium sp.]|uniref:phosphatase PAP2 family protein n=1 Tax=Phenylobacterium sp. TaxID=1871053 RepID=UPI0025E881CA|nr:phosphatase PAP2 family protein [Phenylobacterium sp.]MBA4011263.1 hypothetical protein [Phenylobacterium sp.]
MSEYSDPQPHVDLRTGESWLAALSRALREDRLLYAVIGAYVFATAALAWSLGRHDAATVLLPFLTPLRFLYSGVVLFVVGVDLTRAIGAAPRAPLTEFVSRVRARLTPDIVRPILMILALTAFLGSFTTAKTSLAHFGGFTWDQKLAELDAWLHGGVDPWRLLHPLLAHQPLTRVLQFCYLPVWLTLAFCAPLWVATAPRLASIRTRFLAAYLLTWILLGNVLAATFLSAGPVYFGQVTGDVDRFKPLMDYLAFSAGTSNSSYDLQQWLWLLHSTGQAHTGSGISAFPSLHVAMATLIAILGSLVGRKAFALAVGYLVLILAASVHLGWHYAIDGYASIILTTTLWFALRPLDGRNQTRPIA